jgi:hypothetical protein
VVLLGVTKVYDLAQSRALHVEGKYWIIKKSIIIEKTQQNHGHSRKKQY